MLAPYELSASSSRCHSVLRQDPSLAIIAWSIGQMCRAFLTNKSRDGQVKDVTTFLGIQPIHTLSVSYGFL